MNNVIKGMAVLLVLVTVSCGGAGSSGNTDDLSIGDVVNTTKRVLAKNIIFSDAEAAEGVDTDTKVLASNVMFDPKLATIESENVQGAFSEIKPDLATLLTSTPWKVYTYLNESTKPEPYESGVKFHDNGEISTSGDKPCGFGHYSGELISYKVIANSALQFRHEYDYVVNVFVTNVYQNYVVLRGDNGDLVVFEPHDGLDVVGTGQTSCSASTGGSTSSSPDSDGSSS